MRLAFLLAVLLSGAPVWGSTIDTTATTIQPVGVGLTTASNVPGTFGLVARMVFSLLVVLGLIWGAVQVLHRFSRKSGSSGGFSHIRVLDRAYLAPKRAVYVVQIGSRALALGVTDSQVTRLTDLDPDETRSAYPEPSPGAGSASFASLLGTIRSRWDRDGEVRGV